MSNSEFLWCEEYRPKTIDDCILPDELKSTFKKIEYLAYETTEKYRSCIGQKSKSGLYFIKP